MALPKPLYVRWSLLTIQLLDDTGAPDGAPYQFECSATNIGLVSTGGELSELNTLCPDGSFSESAPRTWSLNITLAQDIESADSFLFFLMDNEGRRAEITWYPKSDASKAPVGFGWTGEVIIALPASVGGVDIANWATTTVVLPFQGTPQRIDSEGNPVTPATPDVTPTGVNAGAPGSFTPAGATPPADLSALDDLGALGQTDAWDEGDYVVLGDGSNAYWDGTAWAEGTTPAPDVLAGELVN